MPSISPSTASPLDYGTAADPAPAFALPGANPGPKKKGRLMVSPIVLPISPCSAGICAGPPDALLYSPCLHKLADLAATCLHHLVLLLLESLQQPNVARLAGNPSALLFAGPRTDWQNVPPAQDAAIITMSLLRERQRNVSKRLITGFSEKNPVRRGLTPCLQCTGGSASLCATRRPAPPLSRLPTAAG